MIIANASIAVIQMAIDDINRAELYAGNIKLKGRPEPIGRRLRFGITVADSAGLGARVSYSGRSIAAACWHAHGHLFDAIFRLAPDAVIKAQGRTITAEAGNWADWPYGPAIAPVPFSTLCRCRHGKPQSKATASKPRDHWAGLMAELYGNGPTAEADTANIAAIESWKGIS